MTASSSEQDITPWYKQFWPWFIFGLPAVVVVAGVITVFIAIDGADHLVVDDYYKQGMGINRLLEQDDTAKALAINAALTLDEVVAEVHLRLQGKFSTYPEQLTLLWAHPADQALDFSITLNKTPRSEAGQAFYLGDLTNKVSGRWYLQLSSLQEPLWRLKKAVVVDAETKGADQRWQVSLSAVEGD